MRLIGLIKHAVPRGPGEPLGKGSPFHIAVRDKTRCRRCCGKTENGIFLRHGKLLNLNNFRLSSFMPDHYKEGLLHPMAEATLTIASKNYGSWSLRGWLLCKMAGLDFIEEMVASNDPATRAELLLLSPPF